MGSIHFEIRDRADSVVVQVRGKTVYLQYSNRQEIINAKNTADTPSNVLLVSLENLLVSHPHSPELNSFEWHSPSVPAFESL